MAEDPQDWSFMADPGAVADWRLVLLSDAAAGSGLLDALPGTPDHLASSLGLDPHATRVVLDALVVFGLVGRGPDGTYVAGATHLDADARAALYHHARVIGQWSRAVGARLRGEEVAGGGPPQDPARWLDALAVGGRRQAPATVDACLVRCPEAKTVLDLGGCHGEYALEFARRGLEVTMQDRPVMIDVVTERGVLDNAGVRLFAGDFFEVMAPGPFDLIFCSGVTNTFGAVRNRALYDQVATVLAPGGTFVIRTSLQGDNATADLFSVQMLSTGGGGGSHPEADYREWLGDAGFGNLDIVRAESGMRTMMFARR